MSIDKFSSRIEFSAMTHFVRDLEDEGRSPVFPHHGVGHHRPRSGERTQPDHARLQQLPRTGQPSARDLDAAQAALALRGRQHRQPRRQQDLLAAPHFGGRARAVAQHRKRRTVPRVRPMSAPSCAGPPWGHRDWAARLPRRRTTGPAHTSNTSATTAPTNYALLVGARAVPTLVVVDGLYSMEGDIAPRMRSPPCAGSSRRCSWSTRRTAGILGATRTGAAELFGYAGRC